MEVNVIITSINELINIVTFRASLVKRNCKIVVIDEGDENLRRNNDKLLQELSHVYYGPHERKEWFKQRFGSGYQRFLSVIPKNTHAETSFGLLVSYEGEADIVIMLDDDVFSLREYNIIEDHDSNLFNNNGVTVHSKGKWYNVMESLHLSSDACLFPRGHPYASEARAEDYVLDDSKGGECVLNMGLWAGHPDLDAMTILHHGGLKGTCAIESRDCKLKKIIIDRGTYFATCSMNMSFPFKIIPAFYQLYMNYMGVDRFDDVWSGIFLKKIADHLGCNICLGKPVVYHRKRPRDTFKDLKKELHGLIMNETLWKIVDELKLDGKSYWDSYDSLAHGLEENVEKFPDKLHQKFMQTQIQKMRLWLELIDKL